MESFAAADRLSSCEVQAQQLGGAGSKARGFSRCGKGLSCSMACGILVPEPGFEVVSFALQGGLLTAEPPGKFLDVIVECPS